MEGAQGQLDRVGASGCRIGELLGDISGRKCFTISSFFYNIFSLFLFPLSPYNVYKTNGAFGKGKVGGEGMKERVRAGKSVRPLCKKHDKHLTTNTLLNSFSTRQTKIFFFSRRHKSCSVVVGFFLSFSYEVMDSFLGEIG